MRRKKIAGYLLQKAIAVLFTLLLVTLFSFLLMRLSPIDPAEAYVKRNSAMVTDEQIAAARVRLGLDKPLYIQYTAWLTNALKLDFGTSLASGHPVIYDLLNALPATFILVGWSALFMTAGSLILGCMGYFANGHWLNKIFRLTGVLGVSIPAFYLAAAFLDLFALKWGVISVVGNTGFAKYGPAAICLAISGICFYAQILADSLIHEMEQDYCSYAKCRGLDESRILICHALPHALIDLLPNFAQMLGLAFAGAAIVERVFSLSGLGYLIIDSVIARDSPMIFASVLVLAGVLVILDLLAEILQKILRREI